MEKHKGKLKYKIGFVIVMVTLLSCADFLEVSAPKTEIANPSVFENDASAASAVSGIYSLMATNPGFANGYLELYTGLSADEFINYTSRPEMMQFEANDLATTNAILVSTFWDEAYIYINNANGILEGIENSTALSASAKAELEGEARFIRAFCYFYLANLFSDVPYITSTDYRVNVSASRLDVKQVYDHIIDDLKIAQNLLLDDFSFSQGERVQPNRGAATALLARIYLYRGRWAEAEQESSKLISNIELYTLPDVSEVFLANSQEAIWQLKPVQPDFNSNQAQIFTLLDVPNDASVGGVALSDTIMSSFEPDDRRRSEWIGMISGDGTDYYFPFKYKVYMSADLTEYSTVFRLAEQYLIRAEARAQQDNLDGAKLDLDAIRTRAGLGGTTADTKEQMLLAIENERKIEFFAEGHRWLDLKRTNRADAVLSGIKPGWQSTDVLYPIPESERLADKQLSQNEGY